MTYNYKPNKKKAKVKITHLGGEENNYRIYGPGDTEEDQQAAFVWFVENILAKISSTRTKFIDHRTDKLVSNIFSAEDEAWALLILKNEYKVWVWDENHPATRTVADTESLQSNNNKKNQGGGPESQKEHHVRCIQVAKVEEKTRSVMAGRRRESNCTMP